jgi:hypothetical protein
VAITPSKKNPSMRINCFEAVKLERFTLDGRGGEFHEGLSAKLIWKSLFIALKLSVKANNLLRGRGCLIE